jgi:uncharacterized RDD family membrane protein YckC
MATSSDPTAVMGRRIAATFIDGLIVFIPTGIITYSSFDTLTRAERLDLPSSVSDAESFCDRYTDLHSEDSGFCFTTGQTVHYSDGDWIGAFSLSLYGLAIFLHVILQAITGWTPGKAMVGLRVVQEDGRKAVFWRVLVRWLLWIVDGLPFAGLVAFITGLTTTGHRRVGDMVAKTYVVPKEYVGRPVAVRGVITAYASTGGAWVGAHPPPTARPGPQWDESRGTYIQWDPEAKDWMQWDETAQRWEPIPTPDIPPPPVATPPPPPPSAPPPPPPPPPT